MNQKWKQRISLAILLLILFIFLITSFGCAGKEKIREQPDYLDPTARIQRWSNTSEVITKNIHKEVRHGE